jgi:FKBP-type peptidyl-prolyl cis-trans isomerase SlyD
MKIENNTVVALTYELSIPDHNGEFDVVEVVNDDQPLYFIYGQSGLPEGFEDNLAGLSEGDSFDFEVAPEDGYGDIDEEAFVELPRSLFDSDQIDQEELLTIGNIIPMTNDEGHQLHGQVTEVGVDFVVMNFNHPLAGKKMHFKGKIVKLRAATQSELDHGHVHGDGGVHH